MPAGVEGSFNSRTPEGVRQHYANYSTKQTNVSIHEPREGCDCTPPCQACPYPCFNSRTPGGVRRGWEIYGHCHAKVSIHAPREGCDSSGSTSGGITSVFQFTHPGRGATAHYGVDVPRGRGVSIHAPREGCDSEILILDDQPSMFQFTHPGRGATGSGAGFPPRELSFNSRTPGGVRRH